MDTLNLRDAQIAAAELKRLQDAATALPGLEHEAALEQARAAAQGRVNELTVGLQSALESFADLKAESDREVGELVAHARTVIENRRQVAEQAGRIKELAYALAGQQWERDRDRQDTRPVIVANVRNEVQMRFEQALIDAGYPSAALMTLPAADDDAGGAVLGVVAGLCGDVIRERRDLSPFSGKVLARIYNEQTSQYEEAWI